MMPVSLKVLLLSAHVISDIDMMMIANKLSSENKLVELT